VSDGHDRLREYLEQRRELGESEFVLDGLSIEDALKAITGKVAAPKAAGAPRAPQSSSGAPPARPDSAMRRNAEQAASSGDWRDALRAVDAPEPAPVAKPTAKSQEKFSAEPTGAVSNDPNRSPSAVGEPMIVGEGRAPSGLAHLETLDAVAHAIGGCSLCTLSSTKIKDVPGEGNPLARFVVVGEAPGQNEDEQGKPFVGKSGDLLTKILDAIGFKRDDVFICNVLKHRPPGNRNPATDEIAACRPFLLRQLELLQPKVILAVGTFAAQTLLETDSPIGKLRGLEHRYHGIPLVATYHPAALLRNPNWKRPAWEDVQLARRIFDRP
jgi:uracil-DNA glycosylase family 4